MRDIRLVYMYIYDSETGLKDIELNFSDKLSFNIYNYDKNFTKCKILVTKKEVKNNITDEFWGKEKHISRIDLIVGKNGSGKTTILECINGCHKGSYFSIYVEEKKNSLKWFFKSHNNCNNINIIQCWDDKNVIPNEVDRETYAHIFYTSNEFILSGISNNIKFKTNEIVYSKKTSSIYKFVNEKLLLLEKYFPKDNLIYRFTLPLDFGYIASNSIFRDTSMLIYKVIDMDNEKIIDYYQSIFDVAINIMKGSFNINKKDDYNFIKIQKIYNEYVGYKDALFIDCFNKVKFNSNILDLLKMNIYISLIFHLYESIDNINLNCIENIKSVKKFNKLLRKELIYIINKSKYKNENEILIKRYSDFDFVEKIFSQINKGLVNIRITYCDGITFEIVSSEKNYSKKDKQIIEVIDFISNIESNNSNIGLKNVGFSKMSSGEKAYLNLFSEIYNIFSLKTTKNGIELHEYDYEYYELYEAYKYINATNYLLILDEPEALFHPEWSRRFIYNITSFINDLLKGTNKKCQFVISTHSPFIVSDIPSSYIKCINLNIDDDGNRNRHINKPKYSFAANIYEILNDGFFMDAPIGEFAQQKIQDIILKINKLEDLALDKVKNEIDNIYNMINIIDDKLIRGRLYNILKEKQKSIINEESPKTIECLMKQIEDLKKEISELKNNENNGEKNDFNK